MWVTKAIFCLDKALPVPHVDDAVWKSALQRSYYASVNVSVDVRCFWFSCMHTDFLSEHSGRVAVYMEKNGILSKTAVSSLRLLARRFSCGHISLQQTVSWTLPPVCPSCYTPLSVWLLQHHFSALLMQPRDADKGDGCSSWPWRHVGTLDLALHQAPVKGLWRWWVKNSCRQSCRALSWGCSVTC